MILDGRAVSEERIGIVRARVAASRLKPVLATIIVGDDPGSRTYVRMKHQACGKAGIGSAGIELPESSSTGEIVEKISSLNNDPEVSGILVQLPLPAHVDTGAVMTAVSPEKDVDGFHPFNLGCLMSGRPRFIPCTPKGIVTLLDHYEIPIAGKKAVVVGRSIDVGRPLAALLLNRDATVTVCHSRTLHLEKETVTADILVSAAGRAGFITTPMVKPGAAVIDVGINYVDGKLCGDVDFAPVRDIAGAISPVPGGVGPMTIASLLENTLEAAEWLARPAP
ncbi:MAG: bifunctional 5,10-methylenetetrahydrofolate dehydrogenase/5,10-methenyltetrahydrofolate cyclohydrolase [Methanoregulaceae archaeon]|nr:bifunctional 5,10-methylenetetrahydrofolate dehydrogenase/5,10-methenyltetrahydrofolate cyclohydrolase [Methanoregulaceae archaeon]